MQAGRERAESSMMPPLGDALYIVCKFLESQPGMQDTVSAMKSDLARNKILGTVNDWKGNSRNAVMEDYNSKSRLLRPNQLMLHLQKSLDTQTCRSTFKKNRCASLLTPLSRVFNHLDAEQVQRVRMYSVDLVQFYIRVRKEEAEKLHIQRRVERLRIEQKLCNNPDEGARRSGSWEKNIVVGGEERTEITDLTQDDNGNNSNGTRAVLTEVGREREIASLMKRVQDLQDSSIMLQYEISHRISLLSQEGCLKQIHTLSKPVQVSIIFRLFLRTMTMCVVQLYFVLRPHSYQLVYVFPDPNL